MRQPPCKQRADLARRDFAAERRAKRNGNDLEHRMRGRGDGRHARVVGCNRFLDADQWPPITIDDEPAAACNETAEPEHGDPAASRCSLDTLIETLVPDQMRDAVAVRDMLEKMQEQGQRHAAQAGADPGKNGDHRESDEWAAGNARAG
jgi:hypothetical protein